MEPKSIIFVFKSSDFYHSDPMLKTHNMLSINSSKNMFSPEESKLHATAY